MSLLIIIFAIAGLTAVSWVGATLYDLVTRDGYGRRSARELPQSHQPDAFDPRRRAA